MAVGEHVLTLCSGLRTHARGGFGGVIPVLNLGFGFSPGADMLCRLGGRGLRPLCALQLGAWGPQRAPTPAGGTKRSALPLWPVRSVSAVSSGGAGGWYEALATSAPVQGAEELLLGAHTATGLPWWGSILLTTVALRGSVTLPLAAYQHYILAKVRGAEPRVDPARSPLLWAVVC